MPERRRQIISELKDVRDGDCLGCYYASDEECKAVIDGFAANALHKGHKVIIIADGWEPTDNPQSDPQGEARPTSSHITGTSRFLCKDIPADGDAFIAFLGAEVNKALGSVWKGVRICLDIGSLPAQLLSNGSFRAFMDKLLSLNRSESCIILCIYGREKVSPNAMMDSLSIHPRVIIGEKLIDNTYFVPSGGADEQGLMHVAVRDCLEGLVRGEGFRREIRELQDKYRFVFENTSDFMFFHDMDGFIKEMKLVDEEVEGYTENDLLRLNLKDLIPARVRNEFDEYVEKIRSDGKAEGIIRILSRRGGERIFEYKAFIVYGESGPVGARGLARDITERFTAREALVKSEEKYRDLFNSISDFVFTHDLEGNFDFEEANDTVRKSWGYKGEENRYRNIRDFIPDKYKSQFPEYLRRIKEKGKDTGLISVINADGSEHILEYRNSLICEDGVTVGVRGIASDITNRIRSEKQLRRSEQRYRDIFNNVSDYLYFHDLEGYFQYEECNNTVRNNWKDMGNGQGRTNLRDIMPERFRGQLDQYLKAIIRKGQDEGPLCIIDKDGAERILEYRNALIYDKDGNPSGVRGSARDITDRVHAEKQLKKSEEKYRTILESIEEGYYEVDLKGRFTFANDPLYRILGTTSSDLSGVSYHAFMDDGVARNIYKSFHEVFESGKDNPAAEWEFIRKKDGRKIYLEGSVSRILAKDGSCTGFRGMIRDITHRVQSERALIESEERYRNIFNNVSDFLYSHDLEGYFDFEETNEQAKEAWGYRDKNNRRMNLIELIPERHKPLFGEYLKRIKEKDLDEGLLTVIFADDGKEHILEYKNLLVSKNGVPVGVQGSARDVTDRIQAQRLLRRSEEKYRSILESIEEGYYEVDLKGNFSFFNESLCRILGCTYEELIGTSYSSFVGEDTARGIYNTFNHVFTTGGDVESADWEFFRKSDGEQIFIEVSVSRALAKNGELRGFRGIVRDVTKRVKAEHALKDSEERYRTILESIEEGYYEVDLSGRITFSNDSMCRIFGCTTQEFNGTNYSSYVKGDTADAIFKTFNMVYKTGRDLGSTQWEFFRKNDGEQIFIEVSVSRILSKTGEIMGFRGMGRDVTRRVHAERALKESEERYRTILESIEEGYYEVDLKGTFTFCNGAMCRITDCSREEFVGMSYRRMADKKSAQVIYAAFHEVYETGRDLAPVSWDFIKKNGERINCEVSVSRILLQDGECTGFRGVVRDVTKRVQAERALMESEHRYRLLAENVNDIIWTADLDFNFTYVSPSVKQVARTTPEETLKLNVRHVMSRDLFKRVVSELGEIMTRAGQGEDVSRIVKRFEFEHSRGDGTMFWADTIASIQIDENGKPVGFVGITRDITDRITADEEIRKNEAKYRSILESIEEGYYETDLAGNLTFFNDSLGRNMGFTAEEMKGRSYRIFMDEDGARTVFQTFKRVFETGKAEKAFGWELIRKDGSRVLTEASILLIRDSNGKPVGFRGLIRDVSERIQAEEFKAAKLKAETENRAKSEFLANMSHEIRTPLNGIIGMTELAMDTSLDENQRDIVRVINRESEILLNLINDILDFSKIEADRYELEVIPFDLRVLIEDLAHSFAMRSEKKGLEFISFLSPDVPARLMGDPGRLRQVIANLAGNSLKFTDKGEIFIKVEKQREYKHKVALKFSVRDTGIGIPREKQQRIFESFTQADGSTTRKYGGTGLGLAISKKIVEMMGGKIGVRSRVGKGSTFFFTAVFPKQKEQRIYPLLDDVDIKGMRVLVVDDNETNRFILMEYLKTWGCIPVDYPGGPETVSVLRAGITVNEPFDLILMDFNMPGLDGFELAGKIRAVKSLKKIPIIILTSLGDLGDGKHCRDIGIQGYLPKPMRRDDLKKAILSVLGISKAEETEEASKLITRHTVVEDYRGDIQILLAEDYPTNQQVAMRHLFKAGYQAEVAENGQQAVAAFKRKRYDLILMDIQMPIMDGYEATKQIRLWEEKLISELPPGSAEHRKRTPIIAMTAHAITGYRDKCIEAGMDDYLAKPLRREELIETVERWIKKTDAKQGEPVGERRQEEGKGDLHMEKKVCPIDLERVMNEFDADRDFLREILGGFLQNVGRQIEIIREAVGQGDAETVRKEAHSIKGGAANICADDLAKEALEMELLGKSGKVDSGLELLQRMEREYLRLDVFYKTEL